MKLVKRFYVWFKLIFSGLWRFIRDYVVPVILFINAIKELLETDIDEKKFNYKSYFADKLKYTQKLITLLVNAFINAAEILIPEAIEELKEKTYLAIILAFVEYFRTLDKPQKSMLFFKLASLMLIELTSDTKFKIKDDEADLLIQLTYSYNKYKKVF